MYHSPDDLAGIKKLHTLDLTAIKGFEGDSNGYATQPLLASIFGDPRGADFRLPELSSPPKNIDPAKIEFLDISGSGFINEADPQFETDLNAALRTGNVTTERLVNTD